MREELGDEVLDYDMLLKVIAECTEDVPPKPLTRLNTTFYEESRDDLKAELKVKREAHHKWAKSGEEVDKLAWKKPCSDFEASVRKLWTSRCTPG
jgi:hypothetical protein